MHELAPAQRRPAAQLEGTFHLAAFTATRCSSSIDLQTHLQRIVLTQAVRRAPDLHRHLGRYGRHVRAIQVDYLDIRDVIEHVEDEPNELVAAVASWLPYCPDLTSFACLLVTERATDPTPALQSLAHSSRCLEQLHLRGFYWSTASFEALNDLVKSAAALETLKIETRTFRENDDPLLARVIPLPASLDSLRALDFPHSRCIHNWSADTAPKIETLTFRVLAATDWTRLHECLGGSLKSLSFHKIVQAPGLDPLFFKDLRTVAIEASPGSVVFANLFAPDTPIERITLLYFDDELIANIQDFVMRQPTPTVKSITVTGSRSYDGYLEWFYSHLLGHRTAREQEEIDRRHAVFVAETQQKLVECREWADAHGIVFTAKDASA